jgi:MYXO-CTERM domain-containing protein
MQPPPPPTADYQGFKGRIFNLGNVTIPYRLFVAKDYDPAKAYPLVLYLHHAGLVGTDNCNQLTQEIGSGGYGGVFVHSAVAKDNTKFVTQDKYPHFLLAPQVTNSNVGFGGGGPGSATGPEHPTRAAMYGILQQVQSEYNIDPRRIYITGISMGCYGTWDFIMRNPTYFAAASPQSCTGDPNQLLLSKLVDSPIWSMCGTADGYYTGAMAMANAMKAVGARAFTFTPFQGVGHSIIDRGYDYPGFIDWMFAQSNPAAGDAGVADAAQRVDAMLADASSVDATAAGGAGPGAPDASPPADASGGGGSSTVASGGAGGTGGSAQDGSAQGGRGGSAGAGAPPPGSAGSDSVAGCNCSVRAHAPSRIAAWAALAVSLVLRRRRRRHVANRRGGTILTIDYRKPRREFGTSHCVQRDSERHPDVYFDDATRNVNQAAEKISTMRRAKHETLPGRRIYDRGCGRASMLRSLARLASVRERKDRQPFLTSRRVRPSPRMVRFWQVPTLGPSNWRRAMTNNTVLWTVVALVALAVVIVATIASRRRTRVRSAELRRRFGPEYDRAVEEMGSEARAERELAARERRVARLRFRDLTDSDRARFESNWNRIQTQFVDDPLKAVASANELIKEVMVARGYPADGFEQRVADLSVEHPEVVQHYRAARTLSDPSRNQAVGTEELRQAVVHYRAMFADLLEEQGTELRPVSEYPEQPAPSPDGHAPHAHH